MLSVRLGAICSSTLLLVDIRPSVRGSDAWDGGWEFPKLLDEVGCEVGITWRRRLRLSRHVQQENYCARDDQNPASHGIATFLDVAHAQSAV